MHAMLLASDQCNHFAKDPQEARLKTVIVTEVGLRDGFQGLSAEGILGENSSLVGVRSIDKSHGSHSGFARSILLIKLFDDQA